MKRWLAALAFLATPLSAEEAAPTEPETCALIAAAADGAGLPRPFFARLIWKRAGSTRRPSAMSALRASPSSCPPPPNGAG